MSAAAAAGSPAVYFLSDFGLADEFVGVVHAVVHRLAPGVPVIDLTHGVPPFDVAAGAGALERAVPHLGPGVVLAVVDPGVGTERRGLALGVPASSGPRWLVGPDNGLMVGAAELLGGIERAVQLRRGAGSARTFDGRDLFGPAAAALALGAAPETVGDPVDADLVARLPASPAVVGVAPDGHSQLRAAVVWVDHFGNLQLAAAAETGPPPGAAVEVRAFRGDAGVGRWDVERAGAFAALAPGALGVIADANGHLAVVAREASAAERTGLGTGDVVELSW